MKYDLIVGFGCSFTEGGGLDNPIVHNFIKNNIEYIGATDVLLSLLI